MLVRKNNLSPRVPFVGTKNRHRPGKMFGRVIEDNAATGQPVEYQFIQWCYEVGRVALAILFEIDRAVQVKFLARVDPVEVAKSPNVVVPLFDKSLSLLPRPSQKDVGTGRSHGD